MLRILTAAVLLPALWATIKLAPPPVFSFVALTVIGIACWECLDLLAKNGSRPFKGLGLAASLAVTWSFLGGGTPRLAPELPLVGLVACSLVCSMGRRDQPAAMLRTTMYTVFPVVFVGLGLAYLAGLRSIPGEDGEDLLMLVFVCVIFADTAAFCFGSWLGEHRMAPVLSPKKSWEGAAAGLGASLLGAIVAKTWFFRRLPWEHALILGLSLGVAALLGDLAESMVKRAGGVKDSSGLLPGHGGVLDRTDSLLFAGPWLYYYYEWFLREAW